MIIFTYPYFSNLADVSIVGELIFSGYGIFAVLCLGLIIDNHFRKQKMPNVSLVVENWIFMEKVELLFGCCRALFGMVGLLIPFPR